ncbi:diguanylate cyclase [Paraburkholderia bengalensis]|uniref:Diguanylate cyclase n=1 Tax=Paraburkholderia bengalensis TaxID=2747562 RepID=A0ABU8J1R7_9BURK
MAEQSVTSAVTLASLPHSQPMYVDEGRCLSLYEAVPVMLHSIDTQGPLVHVSDAWLAALGYERSEVLGKNWTAFLTQEHQQKSADVEISELFRRGHCSDIEYRVHRKDGSIIDVALSAVVTKDTKGFPFSLTVIQDISERKQIQNELIAQRERLRVTLASIGDGVITTDQRGIVEYLNPVAERLTGWSTEAARGSESAKIFRIFDEGSDREQQNTVDSCLAEDRIVCSYEQVVRPVLRDKKGIEHCVEECAAPIVDATGNSVGVVLVFRDVSEQRRLSREIKYRATHDSLTGIYNRTEFDHLLEEALTSATIDESTHALLYIDLDQFKVVNDIGGHAAGDRLLKQVVGIIRGVVRKNDVFARLGGDEFGLILEGCSLRSAQKVAQKICAELDSFRFQYGTHYLHVGASIGLVLIDKNWTTTASLLQAADHACYAAKKEGRNRVHSYLVNDGVIEARRDDTCWIKCLERAFDNGRFVLYWQNIRPLAARGKGIHGEILLRMLDQDEMLISPGAFISVAERFQLVSRIDRWVVRTVFAWMTDHRDELHHVESLAVNLSGMSVGDRDFHVFIKKMIKTHDFDHRKICFEITETIAISNISDALCFVDSMRGYGIKFAWDDFGSGVLSFGYLKRLPFDFVKIDGQFIRSLCLDPIDQATVK